MEGKANIRIKGKDYELRYNMRTMRTTERLLGGRPITDFLYALAQDPPAVSIDFLVCAIAGGLSWMRGRAAKMGKPTHIETLLESEHIDEYLVAVAQGIQDFFPADEEEDDEDEDGEAGQSGSGEPDLGEGRSDSPDETEKGDSTTSTG